MVNKNKIIAIGLISGLLAFAYGYFFSQFTITSDYLFLLWALIAGIFYLAFFLVKSLVIDSRGWVLSSIVADVLLLTAFFWKTAPTLWLALGSALTILFLFIADWRGRIELKNMIEIRFRELKLTVISTAFLSLTFISLFVYISVINLDQIKLSRKPFDYAVESSEGLVQRILPRFSTQINFGDLIKIIVERARPDLSPEVSGNLAEDLSQKISQQTKTAINLQENAFDVLYKIINNLLTRIPENLRLPAVIAFAVLIFFVINGGAFLFIWLISLAAWLIYKLMLTANFVHIKLEKTQKEVVSL